MSEEACIIEAEFCSFRTVNGRKVCQLILEIPIENTQGALERLGVPIPGTSKYVAVALLKKPEPESAVPLRIGADNPPEDDKAQPASSGGHTRKKFSELPLVQQVGIRCADKDFQAFLGQTSEDAAADYLRSYFGVASRRDLKPAHTERWLQLEYRYQQHLTDRQYGEVARRG